MSGMQVHKFCRMSTRAVPLTHGLIPPLPPASHCLRLETQGGHHHGHLGHLRVSLTSRPFSASLTSTSQNKAGKQSPYLAPHPLLPPNQGNVCFLRKYKHEVFCAGAQGALLAALQVPLLLGACYTTQGPSRAPPRPKSPKCTSRIPRL